MTPRTAASRVAVPVGDVVAIGVVYEKVGAAVLTAGAGALVVLAGTGVKADTRETGAVVAVAGAVARVRCGLVVLNAVAGAALATGVSR